MSALANWPDVTESWNVLLDAVPSVVAEPICAIGVVVEARLVVQSTIKAAVISMREIVKTWELSAFIEYREVITYIKIKFPDYWYYCKQFRAFGSRSACEVQRRPSKASRLSITGL